MRVFPDTHFFLSIFFLYPKRKIAKPQYKISDNASTMVVMNGLATTAGSSLTFLASIGNIQPTSFAITTVHINASDTTKQVKGV